MTDSDKHTSARDFHPSILALFDQYVHNVIDRRAFLEGAARFAAGGLTATAILDALTPKFAQAQKVPENDARITAEYIEFPSPKGYGSGRGYLVRPVSARASARGQTQTTSKLPSVLVGHENRGLNPHIEDIARRLALAGFLAFAPDALAPLGGYPGDEDKARELFATLEKPKTRADFIAAAQVLTSRPESKGKLAVIGFCWGGGISNYLATQLPDLNAAVPFYGSGPELDEVPRIRAPLLLHFAETDERVNAGWPAYEAALKAAHVQYEAHTYPGTQHGFHNDTTPRYDAAAAKLAWKRTVEFLRKHTS